MSDGPHSREAEDQVLGCLLIQNEVYDRVVGLLRPEHFFFEAHRIIYAAIGAKIAAGELANPITLKPNFDQHPALSAHGDFNYLATLAANAASIQDAEAYAAAVVDCANRRQLIETADIIRAMAVSGTAPDGSTDILAAAQSIMGGIDPGATKDRMLSLPEFAARAIDQTVAAQDGRLVGHKTGLRDLDSILGGMNGGSLYILAGRTSMGKSGVAISIAEKVARTGAIVGFFSHEMSGEEIGHRALSSVTNIPYTDMRRRAWQPYDLGRIVDAGTCCRPRSTSATGVPRRCR
jgi:replicative DNA helicase